MSTAIAASTTPTQSRREWRGQALLFAAAYLLYGAARWVCVGDIGTARRHAHWIVDLERGLSANVEGGVQGALTGTPAIWLLNHVYIAAQLVVVPGARGCSEPSRRVRGGGRTRAGGRDALARDAHRVALLGPARHAGGRRDRQSLRLRRGRRPGHDSGRLRHRSRR
jgi:hypothetical protein